MEKKFLKEYIDVIEPTGKTFVKWRLGWMRVPDVAEKWLEEMAAEGNHLVRIENARLVFEKGVPKNVAYVVDYQQAKLQSYFDVHKSAGWCLKFTHSSLFTK